MKTKFIAAKMKYDGKQLAPLYAYVNHKLLGDSMVAFIGPCHVAFAEMVDAEDLLQKAKIEGSNMLHFIVEIFNQNLMTGVVLQRLIAATSHAILNKMSPVLQLNPLRREGDDLYYDLKGKPHKLSISIASSSAISTMIHFAVNISNDGTPVRTCSLEDLKVSPKKFADELLRHVSTEYLSIVEATKKVRPL